MAWLLLKGVTYRHRYKDAAVTAGLKAVTAVVTDSTAESGPVVADVGHIRCLSRCTPRCEPPRQLLVSHYCREQS